MICGGAVSNKTRRRRLAIPTQSDKSTVKLKDVFQFNARSDNF